MEIMPIEFIDDWEERIDRQDAFWENRVIDRPVASISIPADNPHYPPPPAKRHKSHRERWWDTEYVVEHALHSVMNRQYLGDSLPHCMPNLGPEVFSAFFGAELQYGERTAWSEPCLTDWDDEDRISFSWDSHYLKKIDELTDALLETGRGRFYTGITDLHPGADAIAAFRDPARLAMDMIECPDRITEMLEHVTDVFCGVYDYFHQRLRNAGQAVCTWAGIVSTAKWYVPSNDFSCMISNDMFRRIFLPGLERECRHLEASIYHLDGPGALHQLDSILGIDELNAIQWVYGAGNGPASKWMEVYKKCREAGKGIQVFLRPEELDLFMQEFGPEGLWLAFDGVKDRETADRIFTKLLKWT